MIIKVYAVIVVYLVRFITVFWH